MLTEKMLEQECSVHVTQRQLARTEAVSAPPDGWVLSPGGRRLVRQAGLTRNQRRQVRAMERGWSPWHRPEHLYMGFLERPRIVSLLFLPAVAETILSIAWGVDRLLRGTTLEALLTVPTLLLGLFLCVAAATFWDTERFVAADDPVLNQPKDIGPGYKTAHNYFLEHKGGNFRLDYTGLVPAAVWQRYKMDARLFDAVYVASAHPEHFTASAARVRADPMLIGRIEDALFLGPMWDIAGELAQASSVGEARAQE